MADRAPTPDTPELSELSANGASVSTMVAFGFDGIFFQECDR